MKELGDKKKNRKKRQRKSKNAAGSYFIWKKRTSRMISWKKSLKKLDINE